MQFFPQKFSEIVKSQPNKTAFVYQGNAISYSQLDALSNKVASKLIRLGAKKDKIYPILLERSVEFVVAEIGVLKAGSAFAPLSVEYPNERIEFIKSDCNCDFAIDKSFMEDIESESEIYEVPNISENDIAFVIYTSGSTGNPKGIVHTHYSFANGIERNMRYSATADDLHLSISPLYFVIFMSDIISPLCAGATIYMMTDSERKDPLLIEEFVLKNKITSAIFSPQLVRRFNLDNTSLKHISCGGERLSEVYVDNCKLFNMYGLSETAGIVTAFEVDKKYGNTPIGKPVEEFSVYLLDENGNEVSDGAEGEICVAGPIAREYLNLPEQSAKAFTENPFAKGEIDRRMLHTGDIGRRLPDGNIEYVDRKDWMIKINGQRVEVSEVELQLARLEGVKGAVVKGFDDDSGQKYICGYYTSDLEFDRKQLADELKKTLPSYMIPRYFVKLEKIPLNANGKVDKKALPKPTLQKSAGGGSLRPMNVIEEKLKAITAEIVGIECFDLDDSLVAIGYTSLSVVSLLKKLYDLYGVRLGVSDLTDEDCTLVTVENLVLNSLLSGGAVKKADKPENDDIVTESLGLCTPQQGIYFETMKHPNSTSYNLPSLISFDKSLDAERLKNAVCSVIRSTPVFTSKIIMQSGKIVQTQLENYEVEVPLIESGESELTAFCGEFVEPFDLENGPLFRIKIVKTESRIAMLFDINHIIFDGLSLANFLAKIKEAYETKKAPQPDISYYDFVRSDIEYLERGIQDEGREYFEAMFSDFETASGITPDLHNNPDDGVIKESINLVDPQEVDSFCKSFSVTPASLFLAATIYTVARFCADDKVYMSMISNGRDDVSYLNSIGMFVRSIPVFGKLESGISVADFIRQTAKNMNTSIKNSAYPLAELTQKFGFASKINYACQLGIEPTIAINGEKVISEEIVLPTPKFDISVHIETLDKKIAVNIQYNDSLYSKKYMDTLSSSLTACVNHMIENPDGLLEKVSLLSENDVKILNKFRAEEFEENEFELFHKMFENQVALNPNSKALTAVDAGYTYAQLNAEANRLANSLIAGGVQKGDTVALLLPRTSRFIISMLGVLKAGGAYIPCDPEYPQDRIEYIIENSGAKYLVTTADKVTQFGSNAVDVEQLLRGENTDTPNVSIEPTDLAYIIYTSGSTGKPKGVMVMHKGIANYLSPNKNNIHVYALKNEATKMLSVTTVSFDMSLKEIGTSLCNGLELVFASEEEAQNPALLVDLFDKTGADAFNATPSRLEQYMMMPSFKSALSRCRIVMCGGEKYSEKLLQNLKNTTKARIFNTYGPTEISVSCNASELTFADNVNVGRPLHNVSEYIVDKNNNLLPPSITGELYVGGYGVTRGYVANKEMTDKSFISFNGERVYKTGDYAKWDENGNVIILGRTDNQVKLRGLRIELGEIERSILADSRINQAVVVIKTINATEHLCAYFCATEPIDEGELKARISKNLTAYMVPTVYVQLDKMPQTPNGKTDVKRLPTPDVSQTSSCEYVAPQSPEEQTLCDIFAEVLHLERVGANDSFFELGGTSLTVTSLLVKMSDAGLEISYGDVFAHKTPSALASLVRGGESDSEKSVREYDYTEIDETLSKNTLQSYVDGNSQGLGNVLLTGVVGFLGIHILHDYLENYDGKIFCLARGNKLLSAKERLQSSLFYYFENGYDELFGKRLFVVEGDVRSREWFSELKDEKVDTVINCAALVKHFSETNDIEEVNIGGVQNLIDFCKENDSMIVQVSTGSVAGVRVNGYPDRDIKFNEQMLYIGQQLDNNKYIFSKFMGERYVLEARRQGVRAKIMRVGNLAARDTDGEFQINFTTNGFMGRLKGYLAIGAFPYSRMNMQVEMAPINATANAILLLCQTPDDCCVFHPFNNHYVPLGDIILQMRRMGFDIKLCEDNEFAQALHKAEQDPEKSKILTTMLAYQNADSTKKVEIISTDTEYTTQVLYRKGFEWSMTSNEYMNKFLEAIAGLGFFNLDSEEAGNV